MDKSKNEIINSDITSGENLSYWVANSEPLNYDKLQENIETDVLVIGGGISGLTTAYCLAKEGKKVTLVEDGYLGSGESGRTTAHITCALDDRYFHLEKIHGAEKAKLAANSHMAAIEWIDKTVKLGKIDCQFKRLNGYLFLHAKDVRETLDKEYQSIKNIGIPVQMLNHVPYMAAEDGKWSIQFADQGQFNIMQYLKGLANAIIEFDGKIYTQTKAKDITKHGAKANGFEIKANHIVVATNTPVNDKFKIHTKQWPYRTYVIAFKIPKNEIPYSLWWDTGNPESNWVTKPYHYVRLQEFNNEFDLLIVGGQDHRTGQANEELIPEIERYTRLAQWAKKRFPKAGEIDFKWSGQIMEPIDSLAFIGRNPGDDNIYIITGDSGNGITHGTLGGIIISDIIFGKPNLWQELYDPSRISFSSSGDYLHEIGNMTAQYTDWISRGDIESVNHLKPGEGGIVSSGLKKTAVYRDLNNDIHAFSAVCPHLGGIVKWNADEKSFDCPCHGSRFTAEGIVINGPAASDLKKIVVKEAEHAEV